MRRWAWTAGVLGLAAGAPASGQMLAESVLGDGVAEQYLVLGNPELELGHALADRYWTGIARGGRSLLRGGLDDFLSPALDAMDHRAAERMMRSFAADFFRAADPRTGLVPYSFDAESQLAGGRTGGRQPVDLVYKAALFLRWFPQDPEVRRGSAALAAATLRAFDTPDGGVWAWASVRTGRGDLPGVHPVQFGQMAEGMHEVSRRTGDARFGRWADAKLAWAWRQRAPGAAGLVCGYFTPRGRRDTDGGLCDTDVLYLTRRLFALHRLTGNPLYRQWALANTDAWMAGGWGSAGHFVRRVRPDGARAADVLYGDGKYNTLWVLTAAYRETRDPRYVARLKQAWRTLRARGTGGLAPETVQGARGGGRVDPQQTLFLAILVDAHQATGDAELLRMARELGAAIRARGESVMRMEGGQAADAFLRLGLASVPMRRVEVELASRSATADFEAGGRTATARGPRRVVVAYLPRAGSAVRVRGGAQIVSDRALPPVQATADQ
ncbi:MAG TPA: hypothetical protein VFX98_19395 [Longimicrobiaceae bacterium]|nr:hypothetical protein [Longimicrobiaceae bacterium]